MNNTFLVTGAAGFIGFHVSLKLLERGEEVLGLDNLNDYYEIKLKENRIEQLSKFKNFKMSVLDLLSYREMELLFKKYKIHKICHLAAQAGVRYSLINPFLYQKSNLEGFLNIIELAKNFKVKNFVYASSSSVYGINKKLPFSVKDRVDLPISLYAATKKANELIAHTYSHLYGLPTTGVRLFTVYGPWGRPDMALFKFTQSILNNKPIEVYNHGKMKRDFTYIDDIVLGIISCLENHKSFEILNIGNSRSESINDFIEIIENSLGKKAIKIYKDIQPGDVEETYADIDRIKEMYGFEPKVSLAEGIPKFIEWYRKYYHV